MLTGRKMAKPFAALALLAALAFPMGAAGAKGGPPAGESLGNNLSVPTHFIGPPLAAVRTACDGLLHTPTGPSVDGYYLQQTEATWGGQCDSITTATVTASWGANLTNGRDLRAGRPIRVEMALFAADSGQGYTVLNLTPELLDRNATYGIPVGAVAETFPYMVYVPGATLTIQLVGGTATTYPLSAEINSTGKVVYGFNWGTTGAISVLPGTYVLTFTVPAGTATISGVDPGEAGNTGYTSTTATVTINVVAGGGGGGGAPGGTPGGGGGGGTGGGGPRGPGGETTVVGPTGSGARGGGPRGGTVMV
jgi:hypothetical protein